MIFVLRPVLRRRFVLFIGNGSFDKLTYRRFVFDEGCAYAIGISLGDVFEDESFNIRALIESYKVCIGHLGALKTADISQGCVADGNALFKPDNGSVHSLLLPIGEAIVGKGSLALRCVDVLDNYIVKVDGSARACVVMRDEDGVMPVISPNSVYMHASYIKSARGEAFVQYSSAEAKQ